MVLKTLIFKTWMLIFFVQSKSDLLANLFVGYPWMALKEAFYDEYGGSLLIVDCDLLANVPQKVMPLIYQFIDEPEFEHDFGHVNYDAPEFDAQLGMHGLHKVRKEVGFIQRETILPPDLFERYTDLSF